ncbi:hypothetical protein Dvina_16325 [Dactylosporangium vinaceum]|uniref:Uncharacterized protein n=1 Tax=Dactylosporangium vinaceum TaxID=53362 RepID=A0ABV5M934_9ACTN|nr:hypothetical protein [Dactylosporangium vinaceum]UAB99493.1 hypothetical protein Dvina_16325 [Dactylosporangium vinaceum]
MSAAPLERRYRRLLHLLPPDHRAARGEELLGLLLDLDEGRDRPSPRQALGVIGLGLRLRLPGAASLLMAALLIAFTAEPARDAYLLSTGAIAFAPDAGSPLSIWTALVLAPTLFRLSVTVAWLLGARRTALALFAAPPAISAVLFGGGVRPVDLLLLPLAAAVIWRWPAPRPRFALLAAIPFAMLLLALTAGLNRPWSSASSLPVAAVVAVIGAAGSVLARRRTPPPAPGRAAPASPADDRRAP